MLEAPGSYFCQEPLCQLFFPFRLGLVEEGSLSSSYCVDLLRFFQRCFGPLVSQREWHGYPQLSSNPAGRPGIEFLPLGFLQELKGG